MKTIVQFSPKIVPLILLTFRDYSKSLYTAPCQYHIAAKHVESDHHIANLLYLDVVSKRNRLELIEIKGLGWYMCTYKIIRKL